MRARPNITVVMPTHNAEKYIASAITSILNQTYRDFELWVLENGSNDRTAEIAEEFDDPRIRVFRLGPVGFQAALTYALEGAETEWIARMDSDDISFPTRLETQMRIAQEHPEYVMVGTAYALLTPFGTIIERLRNVTSRELNRTAVALGGHTPQQPRGRICADPSMLFKRKVALEVGGYDPSFTMGDVPLWLRMLEGRIGWEIAEPLYLYRVLPASFSKTHTEGFEVRAKYSPELLDDLLAFCHVGTPEEACQSNGELEAGFWWHIGFLEALTKDHGTVLRVANKLEELGRDRSARRFRLRAYSGMLGQLYHSWKWRSHYRHRPDLEQLLAPLV